MNVSESIGTVLDEIDPRRRRWDELKVLTYVNAGLRLLSEAKCFLRRDIIVPTAGTGYYTLNAPVRSIERVWYDRNRLTARTFEGVSRKLGQGWQDSNGTPLYYIPTKKGIRIAPAPDTSGTALTFTGSPDITEAEGLRMKGDRYWSALSGSTVVHFMPDDGECTNAETAEKNLWVEYYYRPNPLDLNDDIPENYADALENYAMYRLLRTSNSQADIARRTDAFSLWADLSSKLAVEAKDQLQGGEQRVRTTFRGWM